MEETKKNLEPQASDELEIVELDERLDMAFDPLSIIVSAVPRTNTNCGNTQCCGGKVLM